VTIAQEQTPAELGELRRSVAGWAGRHCNSAARRSPDSPATFWKDLANLGWLGLMIDEAYGGAGRGMPEQSVVLEELGEALLPGPLLPSLWCSTLVQRWGTDAQRSQLLPGLADGTLVGAVSMSGALKGTQQAAGVLVDGTASAVSG
jgi:alkylation response protein AidB-like acyl-CoA dehydrogenase